MVGSLRSVEMADINIAISFGAGVMSFISPCCLSLYPAFISYITGVSVNELNTENGRLHKRSMLHAFFFLVGFSIIFIALGFGTSFIGQWFKDYQDVIRQCGAVLLIVFGLMIAGVFKPSILMRDYRIHPKNRPVGYIGSMLIGIAYAAGWTPCTGPILASLIYLGMTNPSSASLYMFTYILGFSIPFLALSFFIGKLKWIRLYSNLVVKIGGYLMVVMGFFLFFNWMTIVTSYLSMLFDGFQGF